MSYLYYSELGNIGYLDTAGKQTGNYSLFTGPFKNLIKAGYWSVTASSAVPGDAWDFNTSQGLQNVMVESNPYFNAIAVHAGDVAATPTPIPAAAYLFGSGLLGLVGLRKKIQK